MVDPHKWEIGYHENLKEKIYGQILFPIVKANKPIQIN